MQQPDSVLKISWCLLTFNRASIVKNAIAQNILTARYEFQEMIWVDNGSLPEERTEIESFLDQRVGEKLTKVLCPKNLGVDPGYNRALALGRSDWLMITGCDRLMPDYWLKDIVTVIQNTNAKIVSIYSSPLEKVPERVKGQKISIAGLPVCKAMPFGARIVHKDVLKFAGYFREDFGMYGWSDVEWSERAMKVCDKKGWEYLALLHEATHLGDEGTSGEKKGLDPHEYWKWKQAEVKDPKKLQLLASCRESGYPFFSPY